jgi:hypothetical protein
LNIRRKTTYRAEGCVSEVDISKAKIYDALLIDLSTNMRGSFKASVLRKQALPVLQSLKAAFL